MSGIRWLIDQYLQLPRWERIGNIFLICFIFISIAVLSLWPDQELTAQEQKDLDKMELAILEEKEKVSLPYQENKSFSEEKKSNSKPIFISDLYKASAYDFQRAGLSKKVAWNLFNYLKKGGKVKNENDVRKIYGMTDEMATTFLANVKLENTVDTTKHVGNKNTFGPREKTLVNLNTADSATLVFVNGISPKMIPYILKFRNAVGGFHSVEQLNEVFKSPLKNLEDIKPQVTVEGFAPFIKINSVTTEELRKYKYFKKDNLASTLVAYRDKHGKFNKAEDLKKCVLVTEEVYQKIVPYIVFD